MTTSTPAATPPSSAEMRAIVDRAIDRYIAARHDNGSLIARADPRRRGRQQAAIASFPLGAAAGSLWYGLFSATPSAASVAGATEVYSASVQS